MIPVANCRMPISETYDMTVLLSGLLASSPVVMGSPNEREKPIGSTMACVPVTMALTANIPLVILMIDNDGDFRVRPNDPIYYAFVSHALYSPTRPLLRVQVSRKV